MENRGSVEDPSVLNVIKKFANKMINQYLKMYTGINPDFKFDLKLIDVSSREGMERVSDDVRRRYDYVIILTPNQVTPGKIHVNKDKPFYNEMSSRHLKNPYEIPFYEFLNLLREDLKMLGIDLDSVSFGQTLITCPVDYSLTLNEQ